MPARSLFFWLHLTAGLVAGLIIAVMSFTGAALAFEDQIVSWAERDMRRVNVPTASFRLPLDELIARAGATAPAGSRPSGVSVERDPAATVTVAYGRDTAYLINPYTGEVAENRPSLARSFMKSMVEWHRYLARPGDQRPLGKAITGACNLAFLFLAVSGLWLWWPRQWSRRSLRPSLRFVSAKGRYRDWNWHNVIGFWSLPVIIVLTLSGAVIGYKWASDLVYRAAGETPQRPGGAALVFESTLTRPSAEARIISYNEALARIQSTFPDWDVITLRAGLPPRRSEPSATPRKVDPAAPEPYSATIRNSGPWYALNTTHVVIDPFSGDTLARLGYDDFTTGRKIRTWMRYLHTGQALGVVGQSIAAVACIGALVLVYSGFALSWRRFFGKKQKP